MSMTIKAAGAKICRDSFGAVLTQQGRGYYVTLELLAIVWGTYNYNDRILSEDQSGAIGYLRRSHDFARRCMAGDALEDGEDAFVRGPETRIILQALLESLRVPIPNRRVMPGWLGQHLYPYVGELIHYDAAPRRRTVNIERYAYRGAGGLAHKILRIDPNRQRLEANRKGLRALVEDAGGPLGQLAKACGAHDRGKDVTEPFQDDMEEKTTVHNTDWVDHLRQGIQNITSRDLVRAKKVELLMLWVPYCIARHQLDRAAQIVERPPMFLPAAFVSRNSPVRQVARRELAQARGLVDEALRLGAEQRAKGLSDKSEAGVFLNLVTNRGWRNPILGFFTQTLATVGAINAHVGARHLTLQLPLLEAMVCASLAPNEQVNFEEFCERILGGFRIIADSRTPPGKVLLSRVDAADLDENAEQLARELNGLGLLTSYSDATRMVHGEIV